MMIRAWNMRAKGEMGPQLRKHNDGYLSWIYWRMSALLTSRATLPTLILLEEVLP